ncbi:MAG: peptidase M28 [Acidobacteria bacterium]|nr:MAG: peptidase M28 [Acidobacteriota bacterium]
MRKLKLLMAIVLVVAIRVPHLDAQASKTTNKPEAGSVQADPQKIRAHVKFLSSDLLEGRGTGQRGGDIAAEYIATEFALYGLKPAGDQGTYFHEVPMVGVKTLDETSFNLASSAGTIKLKNLEDFVTNNESQTETAYIDAPIVFVGYGINAPEYNWDDYKGADLKGKVALLFVNEPAFDDPKFFKGKALTYYGRWTYKFEETARRGAVATLIIHRPDLASYGWQVVRNSWGKERSYLKIDATPKLRAASWIQLEVAKKLVAMGGLDLDKLFEQSQSKDFKPIELPVRLQAHIASQLRPFVSRNVLAALPSRGPMSQQAVLYTAHYDHLGIDPEMKGHNIYNGAVDNATGCGVLLELARVWSESSVAVERTILFVAVTAEEQGLLGSEYLAKHSPVPPGKISLDLNYDALGPIGDPEEVEVNGAERTTFYSTVEAKAKALGLAIRPDPHPEAGYYYRSDHFSLARAGIPSFSISEGVKFKGHDAAWGETQERDYVEHRYHQPTDQYMPQMDFTGDAKLATFGYELGMQAALQLNLVSWLPGDEFEAERKRSQALDRRPSQPPPPRRKIKPHKP